MKAARDQGAEWGGRPGDDFEVWKDAATGGHGADFVAVTAASESSEPLALAAELCRQKGRIACVGSTAMHLDRRWLYEKELELRMSMSYGPGRYDRRYEELGLDYPLSYVRWTENRYLDAFLALLRSGAVDPLALDIRELPFAEAERAYEDLAKDRGSARTSAGGCTADGSHGQHLRAKQGWRCAKWRWRCEHLPYLVKLVNWDVSNRPGQPNVGGCWVCGYDEISWFAHQDEAYRIQWLRYAWNWVREHDPNGFFQMPGSRVLHAPVGNQHWYYANTRSEAVLQGFGQKETIKAIWSGNMIKEATPQP